MSHLLQIDMAWPRCALAITTWPGSDMTYFITVGCPGGSQDRKSTRLNSSHSQISYAVFCLKKKNKSLYHAQAHKATALRRRLNHRSCAPRQQESNVQYQENSHAQPYYYHQPHRTSRLPKLG